MAQAELINVFKYIVKKCDMLINNDDYEADAYTQDTVEDIAELCNHILDEDYGKLVEVKEVDLEKELDKFYGMYRKDGKTFLLEDNEECVDWKVDCNPKFEIGFAKHFYELGLKVAQKGK